ncbi:MAG: sugar ABC transporter permease, partial [Gemmatimonadota bacterium]
MRPRTRVLVAFIALPLLLAAAGGARLVGAARRDAATRQLMAKAGALLDTLESPAPSATTGTAAGGNPARLARLARDLADHATGADRAAVYRLAQDSSLHRVGGTAPDLPTTLPAAIGRRLALHDRTLARRVGDRTAAVAPVKDADDWDLIGALVLRPANAAPPPVPLRTLLAGLLAWLVACAAAWRFAGPRRGVEKAALAVIVLGACLMFDVHVVQQGGRLAALVLLGAAGTLALVGLSLVGIAERGMRLRQALHAWAFVTPSLAHLLLFSVGPILFAFYLSFHRWNLVEARRPFVGLANYRALLGDAGFGHALVNTAIYVLFVPVGMAVALGLALLVNRRMHGLRLLRTVFFLPYITSFVAISLVWKWMYNPDFG